MHLKFYLACRLSPKIDGFWERSVRGRHSCWTLLALVVFFSVLALVGYKYGRDAAAKVAAFFSLPSVFEGVFVPIVFLVCIALWYVYDQVKCAYAEFRDGWRRSTALPQCIGDAAAACTSPRQWAKKRSKLTRFFMLDALPLLLLSHTQINVYCGHMQLYRCWAQRSCWHQYSIEQPYTTTPYHGEVVYHE
jgi:hypothetical protein